MDSNKHWETTSSGRVNPDHTLAAKHAATNGLPLFFLVFPRVSNWLLAQGLPPMQKLALIGRAEHACHWTKNSPVQPYDDVLLKKNRGIRLAPCHLSIGCRMFLTGVTHQVPLSKERDEGPSFFAGLSSTLSATKLPPPKERVDHFQKLIVQICDLCV